MFRNSIPPTRDYKPPSFEDIFEKTTDREDKESTTRSPHKMAAFDLFSRFPETDRNSESTTSSYFRTQLQQMKERNKQMLFGDTPRISTTQKTTERPDDELEMKRREGEYLKAQKKLLQLQR